MVWMVNSNLENLNCQDARSCQGGRATVTNPSNFLVFQCGGEQSCNGADLTISLTPDALSPITNIDGIIMRGDGSGKDATITLDNQQGLDQFGNAIITSLDRILCEGRRSCVNTKFMVGYNVAVGNIVCARGACRGCTVQIDAQVCYNAVCVLSIFFPLESDWRCISIFPLDFDCKFSYFSHCKVTRNLVQFVHWNLTENIVFFRNLLSKIDSKCL